ncbi:MAG: VWA domain-containing protein [Candidatus Thorarchaeota archaeon]
MKLQAIRGRNQRGISYVSDNLDMPTGTVKLIAEKASVFATLKKNDRVLEEQIILDKRHFDFLDLKSDDLIAIERVKDDIPICTELVLSISSKRALDASRIVEALSQKIEDLEAYIDGLILETDKTFYLEELGVAVTPSAMVPLSNDLNAARVAWRKVMKIYLRAARSADNFNLCTLMEIGASSQKRDISLESNDSGPSARYEISQSLVIALAREYTGKNVIFAPLAFSTNVSDFSEDDTIMLTDDVIEQYEKWVLHCVDDHKGNASDLTLALETGVAIAKRSYERNPVPTFIILFSSGSYSHGINPVPIVRNLLSETEGIYLACVGIGSRIDDSLLQAIAANGNGILITIDRVAQLDHAKNQLDNWIKSEV